MSEPEFVLKTTPPRLPRAALDRPRLMRLWEEMRERTAIAVCAPAGYGKTTLLGQWRRRWLEQGALVAWLSVDAKDDPTRFTLGLLHALRTASGRPAFAALAAQAERELGTLTAVLAEIAGLGGETVLIIDDAERLPETTAAGPLAYLLHNAPPNLHLLIGSRSALALHTGTLVAKGQLATLRTEDLRLRPEESVAILEKRFGARLTLDDAMRLHEASDSWPIGLQLAAAAIELAPEPAAAIASLSGRHADLSRYFLESLFARLPEALAGFLTEISALEYVHPELCEAVTGDLLASDYLEQLQVDTPILTVGEIPGWGRLHPLARDFLRGRFEQLPAERQVAVHLRARDWFAGRGRFHEAACHALAAGDTDAAHGYAMQSLWPLATTGRLAEAREWLDRIPAATLARDRESRLIGAWVMALGERHEEAFRIAMETLADEGAPLRLRAIACRVAAGAAAYADRVGLIPDIFVRWPDQVIREDSADDIVYISAQANSTALAAMHSGDTARALQFAEDMVRRFDGLEPMRLALAFSRGIGALVLLWEGRPQRVVEWLQTAMQDAERREGRRGVIAALYAPILATALLELGHDEEARSVLAGRLDVIEQVGFPDVLWLAHRTLARLALAQGDERRARHVLDNLSVLAQRRRLPRLAMLGLAESARLHALAGRAESAHAALLALVAMAPAFANEEFAPFVPQHRLACAFARAYVALGDQDPDAAERHLDEADALARQLNRGRDRLSAMVLRAVAGRQRNAVAALPRLAEALSLATLTGQVRLLADAHPVAVHMGHELRLQYGAGGVADRQRSPRPPKLEPAANAANPSVSAVARAALVRSGPLTPKEAEILVLLDNGLSNKLIARALEISDETVKWHLKNLFMKLAAGSRKHAVDRARLLGLIEG